MSSAPGQPRASRAARTLAAILLLVVPAPALAGGAAVLWQEGKPFLWPGGGAAIPFHPDRGGLGLLDHDGAVAMVEEAFGRWQQIPTASATFVNGGVLPVDVNGDNFVPFFLPPAPDGLSAVVFDHDGSIFRQIFGSNTGILGFASPEWVDTTDGRVIEGQAFLNGEPFVRGVFPASELLAVAVHEFGHYCNLQHTSVNGQIVQFNDTRGPAPFDIFPPESLFQKIETMYPRIIVGGGQDSPHADDAAIFSSLYPDPSFAAITGIIQGVVLGPNGRTRLTGVNVVARNLANPFVDAVSAITSHEALVRSQDNPRTGAFRITGLTPGASYAVYADELQANAYATPRLSPLPGPEEFYNGAGESTDPVADDPSQFTPVPVAAGVPTGGIDILMNRPSPGPIGLRRNGVFQLFPPFPIGLCGAEFEDLFVDANGGLTFGVGVSFPLESVDGFLGGPPRVAALWDDLNPAAPGAEVSFSETRNAFTVSYRSVPEFRRIGANSFDITLFRASDRVELTYGDITARDGLAGISCGGRVTNAREKEVDLSRVAGRATYNARNQTAVLESFDGNDNDLSGRVLTFNAPNAFKDLDEPNDTLGQATRIRLPFNSSERTTALGPGGDRDFFRFAGRAGETVIAQTVPGNQVDTVLGLFELAGGALLAVNDDGGAGVLSRLVFTLPSDGLYAMGVTSFPDLDFTGTGGDFGRFVLDIRAFRGQVLTLADDGFVEIPIGFPFLFQGRSWERVFVNANGNLTFGKGDAEFEPTPARLLAGPPRIAPLWDDLSPDRGGAVVVEGGPTALTVRFVDVPEFFAVGANSFAVTLEAGGAIRFQYGATNQHDGIVGITPGGGAADPGPTDLSAAGTLPAAGTVYERFGPGALDLDRRTLVFTGP